MPEFGDPEFLDEREPMNSAIEQSIDRSVGPYSGPGTIDRAALRLGIVLVEWARRARARQAEHEAHRAARAARAHEQNLLRAERERRESRIESQLLFRNIR